MKKHTKVVYDSKGRYISLPVDYVKALQMNNQRDKARAFMEYFLDMNDDELNAIRFYAKAWSVGKTTSSEWMKDFKLAIDKHHAYWFLKNQQQYNHASNENGHKTDSKENQNGQDKEEQTPIVPTNKESITDSKENQNDPKTDEDNKTLNKNIYVESKDSDNNLSSINKKSKHSYSDSFEILWNTYGKKSGSKKRADGIYLKRWKLTDIKILEEAIDKYKAETNPQFYKDFDGLLNGVIDTYIPQRAWVRDSFKQKHTGYFYDKENKFISDANEKLTIESKMIAEYIKEKRFGYVS